MLRYLDSQVGRPMSLTRAENLHKEPDDIITYVLLSLCLSVCLSVCHQATVARRCDIQKYETVLYCSVWWFV